MSAARYNPITHHGEVGAPESARSKGLKLSTCAATVGHLQGGACMTKETPRKPGAGPSPKARREAAAAAAPQLPAKVDHLAGTACVPRPGTQEPARRSGGGSGAHGSGEAGGEPAVNLRASVDHLAGGACTVRDVVAQATKEVVAPTVARGMITKHTRDKMAAKEMNEAMFGSMVF